MHHRGAQPGVRAAIALIDMLDDFFAALVLKIDINVGGLVAGLGHEAFKHHRANFGADRGDAKAITQHRIGGRTTALTQDASRPGKGDNIAHGQEIGLVFQLGDQGQLMCEHGFDPGGRPRRVAPFQPFVGQARQAGGGGFAVRDLGRVFVSQFVQGKGAAFGDVATALHRVRMAFEQVQHFGP